MVKKISIKQQLLSQFSMLVDEIAEVENHLMAVSEEDMHRHDPGYAMTEVEIAREKVRMVGVLLGTERK